MHPEAGHFVMLILSPSKRPGAAVRAQHPTGLSAVQTQHDKFTWSAGISDFQVTPTVFLTSATCRLSTVKLPFSDGKIEFLCVVFCFCFTATKSQRNSLLFTPLSLVSWLSPIFFAEKKFPTGGC